MKKKIQSFFIISSTLIFFSLSGFAQNGSIRGKVIDKAFAEALIGVSVGIEGTSQGVSTDVNGMYNLTNLKPGKYSLIFRYLGYQPKQVTDVVVTNGGATVLNVTLDETSKQSLNEVVVTAKANRENETALLVERKNATIVVQKIGALELSRKGVSNVGEGVSKISGVSVVGNKAVFVRGLGDRYNNATLNGLPIPSTNPDVKLIPLDLFPTSIVKNISVVKSYTSQFYGDFSGGSIDIVTKDYPETSFLKVSLSSGYNSITTGSRFLQTNPSTKSFFGFSGGDRKLPAFVESTQGYDSFTNGNNENPGFATPWSPQIKTAPVNNGISISGGNLYKFNDGKELGFLANASFKNEYRYFEGVSALFNAQQSPRYLYDTETFIYNTNTSGLFNLYYKHSAKATYNFTGLFVNDANDGIYDNTGFQFDLGDISGRRNTYIQNTLLSGQLNSNYKLSERSALVWAFGYTKTTGNTPDRTQNTFRNVNGNSFFVTDAVSNNHKFFADLDDSELSGKVEFDIKSKSEEKAFKSVQFGLNGRFKDRVFDARQIDTKIALTDNVDPNKVDATLTGDNLGDGNTAGTFKYTESYYAPNNYRADLLIAAPYANFNLEWNKTILLTAGLRVEASTQNIFYKDGGATLSAPFKQKQLTNLDFLPGATLKFINSEKSNFLLAASRTISRPLFVEVAPFRLNTAAATAEIQGNTQLVNSANYNLDLKYEIYPSNGELFAVSLFGKYIQNPIELAQVNSSDDLFSYINTDEAVVTGIEVEANRNLGSLVQSESKIIKNMSVGFNASYLYTQIKIDPNKIAEKGVAINPTNLKRPLFGASPYLVNVDFSYKKDWSKDANTMFTVAYNVFGKRLFVAGSQGAGDIYEMPVNTLDFVMNTKFNKKVGLDLTFGNILNPDIIYNQEYSTNDLTFSNIKRGFNVGLNLNYTF
ncbi:TonB-dependent receptor [Pedobacter alpinus]|uniref:Carboxypeptidase-like regulatory domain-containing protein n=1 Tax=Pedobacter alpinus TaxID=1590643 RepID=A0ABW5TP62_9SPHI